jgi:hypothetical protein
MSLPNEVNLHHLGSTGYTVNQSLRFRSSASAYLNRTPSTAGSRTTWTWSGWVKLGALNPSSGWNAIFGAYSDDDNRTFFYTNNNSVPNAFYFFNVTGGTATCTLISTQVLRDPSAWYHLVVSVDTTQGTSTNRVKIYLNGSQITSFGTATYPSSSANFMVNNNVAHYIGASNFSGLSLFHDGYMAEVNFIDGQALTPSSFGSTNSLTGVWQPAKYTGTYGTNGFYLPFTNTTSTTTLGYDFSGNSNNWTTNNLSLTAGTTYDWMRDSPSLGALASNHCTLNALNKYSGSTVSAGGLKVTHGSSGDGWCTTGSTMAFPETGKWYAEFFITSRAFSGSVMIGISETNRSFVNQSGDTARYSWGRGYFDNASTFIGPSNGTTGSVTNYTTNDTIMLAFDSDNGKVWWGKNGTWYGTGASPDPATGVSAAYTGLTRAAYPMGFVATCEGYSSSVVDANFGQRPFTYTPPSGFKALNTYNLPTPTIGGTSTTLANKYFDATLYTGNGTTQSITGVGFQPDFVWIKGRSLVSNNRIYDVIRGATKSIYTDLTDAEGTESTGLTSFNSNGFSVGSQLGHNQNGSTYVGWSWKANGAGSSNTSGSITSTVSVNASAGFSVVTYTGTGSNATVGHGLGVAPSMVIVKSRVNAYDWVVYNSSIGNTKKLYLNLTSAEVVDSTAWNNTSPTSSTFSLGSNVGVNQSSSTYVAYCWSEIAGFSKFGSYTGNGSTNGTFVYTGFRPKFVLTKSTIVAHDWNIWDSSRSTYNAAGLLLQPNSSGAEQSPYNVDLLSNGFKFYDSNATWNGSGETYIYMAFAENPFKYALAR